MTHARRSLAYVLLIIAIIILPTALMLTWYQYSRNPNLRPLAVTREALRAYGLPGSGIDVVVYVDWPAASMDHASRLQLAKDLRISFASKGVEPTIVFRSYGGQPRVTYTVGKSEFGPYSARRAAEGVAAAVEAYRMY